METLIPKGLNHLRFAVVGRDDYVVSLHQHPDAAERFAADSPRNDLRVVMLPRLDGREINFEEPKPF